MESRLTGEFSAAVASGEPGPRASFQNTRSHVFWKKMPYWQEMDVDSVVDRVVKAAKGQSAKKPPLKAWLKMIVFSHDEKTAKTRMCWYSRKG